MIPKLPNINLAEKHSNLTADQATAQCTSFQSACGKEPNKTVSTIGAFMSFGIINPHTKWLKCSENATNQCTSLQEAAAAEEAAQTHSAAIAALGAPTAGVTQGSGSNTLLYGIIAVVVVGGIIFAISKISKPKTILAATPTVAAKPVK